MALYPPLKVQRKLKFFHFHGKHYLNMIMLVMMYHFYYRSPQFNLKSMMMLYYCHNLFWYGFL